MGNSNQKLNNRHIGSTDYKYVYELKNNRDQTFYSARKKILGKNYHVSNPTAKGAALQLDIKLIESGLQPINILKPKL